MAMRTAQPAWGSWGTSAGGSLLLLLLSLGWAFPSRAQAADSRLGVMTPWLQGTSRVLSWWRPELSVFLSRDRRDTDSKVCPPARKAHVIDENLVFYEEWELEACVDGALLAAQMDRVNMVPFTYQQLDVFKRKLDEPRGHPQVERDIVGNREISSSSQQRAEEGRSGGCPDCPLCGGRGRAGPGHPGHAGHLQARIPVFPQSGAAALCAAQRPLARTAFQNVSGPEYFSRIKPFLGGAPTEDLRALSSQKVNMDVATFQKLQTEAVLPLTIAEVQNLLGPNLVGLKAEQERSPVRDWIVRQQQDDLDSLGLGLHGGLPNGYLVMDLRLREALSGGACLVGPRTVLTAIPTLLLALIPK
ncbi:mesothelin-like isoform X2 [Neovison vison]|uniref:mesothelin-like isoform X2 n=1 Tax=Neovison vison TaxID=452646 RepID=UPI001CEFE702|nr:mesothelin-like isoform X2 [Neogale vison]